MVGPGGFVGSRSPDRAPPAHNTPIPTAATIVHFLVFMSLNPFLAVDFLV
jgi:hypothetical protein